MGKPQWAADIDVDVELASELIRAHFPNLDVRSVVAFGNGWDNTAFLVDGTLLVRFPRRAAFAHLIETEAAILPEIAAALPLAISAPTFVGLPSERYPYTFAGYPLIAGRTAIMLGLTDEQRTALAAPLAKFLRALHNLPVDELIHRGLPKDELGRLNHSKRRAFCQTRIERLSESGDLPRGDVYMRWMDAHPPQSPEPGTLCVVHGDLYAQHIVLDDEMLPMGIIDWGDIHLGDIGIDLAVAHQILPATAHAQFIDAYGPVDERAWNVARYRAIYHALMELEFGVSEGDALMRDAGQWALQAIQPHLS